MACLKLLLELVQIVNCFDLLKIYMFDAHAYSISYFEQIFGKLTNRELFFVFNHFPISSHSVFIFLDLLCVFNPDHFYLFL